MLVEREREGWRWMGSCCQWQWTTKPGMAREGHEKGTRWPPRMSVLIPFSIHLLISTRQRWFPRLLSIINSWLPTFPSGASPLFPPSPGPVCYLNHTNLSPPLLHYMCSKLKQVGVATCVVYSFMYACVWWVLFKRST